MEALRANRSRRPDVHTQFPGVITPLHSELISLIGGIRWPLRVSRGANNYFLDTKIRYFDSLTEKKNGLNRAPVAQVPQLPDVGRK